MKNTKKNELDLKDKALEYMQALVDLENKIFLKEIEENVPHKCPVCGKTKFPKLMSYEVCKICYWFDDGVSELNPSKFTGFSNKYNLIESIKIYKERQ